MTVSERNPELVDILRSDFQGRYEPNFAWGNTISNHLALPGLRAFWPLSSVGYAVASRALDLGGAGNHLSDNNTCDFAYSGLIPYVIFDGVNQYLNRADGGAANWADILGTEAYIATAAQGLSFGGWFYPAAWPGPGGEHGLMSKWDDNAVNQRGYKLTLLGTNQFRFEISSTGVNVFTVTSTITGAVNNWYHVVGTYDPGAEIAIFINGEPTTNAAAIPANLFDNTADFMIGRYSTAAARYMQGNATLCWLSAMWYDDYQVKALYEQSRALFGV